MVVRFRVLELREGSMFWESLFHLLIVDVFGDLFNLCQFLLPLICILMQFYYCCKPYF